MSVRSLILAQVFFLVVSAPAATLTATNFDGPDSHLLTRSDGTLFFNGLVKVGTFDIDNAAIQDAFATGRLDYLQSQFRQFGRSVSVNFNGLPALYQDSLTQAVAEGDDFAGRQVYTVIADQGLIRLAQELLIFQHDEVFLPDPMRNEPALLDEDDGELLVGDFDRFQRTLDQIMDQPTFSLASVIPEPGSSAMLLLGLGSLLARRRRNRF